MVNDEKERTSKELRKVEGDLEAQGEVMSVEKEKNEKIRAECEEMKKENDLIEEELMRVKKKLMRAKKAGLFRRIFKKY